MSNGVGCLFSFFSCCGVAVMVVLVVTMFLIAVFLLLSLLLLLWTKLEYARLVLILPRMFCTSAQTCCNQLCFCFVLSLDPVD